ncbi:MAG: flippase-like domain-containing protein [Planctomycetes bacterium]|nr:flippase-like domain-containing protein [Planctomycetota bacterium]
MSQTSSRSHLISILKFAAQFALAVGILGFLVWFNRNDLVNLWQQPKRWGFLALGFVFCLAAMLITFVRWCLLIWAQGLPFRLADGMRIGFIGYLFNQIIPGAVMGDLVKAVFLAREQQRRTVAIATVVIDRIVGMYGLVLVAGLAALVFWRNLQAMPVLRDFGIWVLVVAGIGTLGFGLLFTPLLYRQAWTAWLGRLPVVGHLIREILGAMAVYHGTQRVVLLAVVMSIAVHLGLVSSLFCAALALRPGWPARVHYVLAPIGLTINAIPLTPGGAGLGEGGMQFLFKSVGEDGAIAFAMMVAFRAMCWLIALVGVRFLVASFTETRRAIAEAQPGEPAAPLVPAESAD